MSPKTPKVTLLALHQYKGIHSVGHNILPYGTDTLDTSVVNCEPVQPAMMVNYYMTPGYSGFHHELII